MKKYKIYIRIFLLIILVLSIMLLYSNYGMDFTTRVKITQPEDIEKTLAKNLESHVIELSSVIGNRSYQDYDNLKKTEQYILNEFIEMGYEPNLQEYSIGNQEFNNIIVKKSSKKHGVLPIIIGAHYDTHSNPGADDNTSGVAGVIEFARLLKDKDISTPIEFVAFVNEEPPFFHSDDMGSMVYAKSLYEDKIQIQGAIVLEMIGYYSDEFASQKYPRPIGIMYPNKGNYILAVGNKNSGKFISNISKKFKSSCGMPMRDISLNIPGTDFSDHWSFWQYDYPAMMLTDTAYYRNENYHTQEDTYEKLNYSYMAETIWGLYNSID